MYYGRRRKRKRKNTKVIAGLVFAGLCPWTYRKVGANARGTLFHMDNGSKYPRPASFVTALR